MNRLLLALLLTVSAASALPAQDAAVADVQTGARALAPGTRVRVSAPGVSRRGITGRIVGVRSDSLVLEGGGDENRAIPLFRVERVDVSEGRDRIMGALRGGAAGAIGGILFLGVLNDDPGRQVETGEKVDGPIDLDDAIADAGTGALAGIVVGALVGVERWRTVGRSPEVTVAPAPGGGTSVAIRLRLK